MSQVGRRYDINANLIFKWRRDPRYRPTEGGEGALSFLPVVAEPASAPHAAQAERDRRRIKCNLERPGCSAFATGRKPPAFKPTASQFAKRRPVPWQNP